MKRFLALLLLDLELLLGASQGPSLELDEIEMIDIPAGSFIMGSCVSMAGTVCVDADADARDWEAPRRRVRIGAFQLGRTEVTLGQFKAFIQNAGREDLLSSDFLRSNDKGDEAPVVGVSWEDAQAFVAWLNQTRGGGWRLPSEAEWEYACRAGGAHRYCGSDEPDAAAWYGSALRQQPVAGKQANRWGLHDMSGNVREWVQDCWHHGYRDAPKDGRAWEQACGINGRVLRGGAWDSAESGIRAVSRNLNSPQVRLDCNGFRLARAPVAERA